MQNPLLGVEGADEIGADEFSRLSINNAITDHIDIHVLFRLSLLQFQLDIAVTSLVYTKNGLTVYFWMVAESHVLQGFR